MAAYPQTVERRSPGGGILLLLALAVLAFGLLHAVERHGAVASHISQLCGQGQYQAELTNPLTGRKGRVCQISDGGWGIAVYEANELVTAFKNRAKTLEEAVAFLVKLGYVP